MTNFGIKVAKEGFDAKTADTKDLIIDSSKNAFKIFVEGSGNGKGIITIAHVLDFVPSFLAFCELETGKVYSIATTVYSLEEMAFVSFTAYSNINNLVIGIGAASNKNYYYYIFGDTAKEFLTTSVLPDPDTYGLRISRESKDAKELYVENFISASDLPSMKILTVGDVEIDASGGGANESIAHGLDFAPAFMVWGRKQGESKYAFLPSYVIDGRNLYAYTTSSNLVIQAYPGLDTGIYEFKYLIFAERAKA